MNPADLPCALVGHFVDALSEDDLDRMERILGKVRRAGDDIVPELAATLEVVPDGPLLNAVSLLAVATKRPRGRALFLRCCALSDEARGSPEIEETCELDPAAWAEAALLLLPAAGPEDRDLRDVCVRALACAEPGTPGVLDALVAQLGALPSEAAIALARHDDPAAGPALLEWFRATPDVGALSSSECATASQACVALSDWGTKLDVTDLKRLSAVMKRDNARLAALVRRVTREADRLDRSRHSIRTRSADRRETGPNVPCECGSGKKTKRCCG